METSSVFCIEKQCLQQPSGNSSGTYPDGLGNLGPAGGKECHSFQRGYREVLVSLWKRTPLKLQTLQLKSGRGELDDTVFPQLSE